MRNQHIEFIQKDTAERGEKIVSDIRFMGAIYQMKVNAENATRNKTIMYSAAKEVLKGYRKIVIS